MRVKWFLIAVAGAAVGTVAAPAGFASAEESAQETISRLQSQGYTVTIDRIGTGPLTECVVTNVRNPQQVSQLMPYPGPGLGGDRILLPAVTSQTVSVSLNCQR